MRLNILMLAAPIIVGASTAASATTIVNFHANGTAENSWLAPYTTDYTVVMAGGAGGDSYVDGYSTLSAYGGAGAITFGTFRITAGTLLSFGIGGRGHDGAYRTGGGGGGGTTFYTTGRILQMVAGGGGGAGHQQDGLGGTVTLAGSSTGDARPGQGLSGSGGEAGHSTFTFYGQAPGAGGGAGLFGAGGSDNNIGGGQGGSGAIGGYSIYTDNLGRGASGGVAGGSAGTFIGFRQYNNAGTGGGGGGYNGGAGGDSYGDVFAQQLYGRAGGGGGSYNRLTGSAGISGGANGGAGFVQISYNYIAPPPPPPPVDPDPTPPPPTVPPVTGGVPEPASWAMLIAGFGMLGAMARRQGRTTVRSRNNSCPAVFS